MPTASSTPVAHRPECVLVTGGAGFIGANFLLRMAPRYPEVTFVNLDRLTYAGNLMNLTSIEDAHNYRFVQCDVADASLVQDLFAAHRFTTVVHFAAESHVDRSIMAPLAFVQSNTVGTVVLLEAARHALTDHDDDPTSYRFFHVSTDEVFGSLGPDDPAFTERTPYAPNSPYSASKAASDHLVRAWGETYGLPILVTNSSNNYGPYHFPEKLIPVVILSALAGRLIPIYGDGENVRDWLYVEDHAVALLLVLARGRPGETYNIGGEAEARNIDLVRMICRVLDARRPEGAPHARLITFVADRPGHDFRYAMDTAKIRTELGWRPSVALEEGLGLTVDWFLENEPWWHALQEREGVGQRRGLGA